MPVIRLLRSLKNIKKIKNIKAKNITNSTANSTNVSASFKTNNLNNSIEENTPLNANNSSSTENSSADKAIAPEVSANEKENNVETGPKISTTGHMVSNYLKFITALVDQLIRSLLSWF